MNLLFFPSFKKVYTYLMGFVIKLKFHKFSVTPKTFVEKIIQKMWYKKLIQFFVC